MIKKYPTCKLMRFITLSMYRSAVEIHGEILIFGKLYKMNINDIDAITYDMGHERLHGFYFAIYEKTGRVKVISPSLMNREVFLEFFRDLKKINPSIKVAEHIEPILSKAPNKIKFNFQVLSKEERAYKDIQFMRENPTLHKGIALVFIIIFAAIAFPLVEYLSSSEIDIEIYQGIFIFFSALTLFLFLSHILLALYSEYRGHKVTLILGLLSIVFAGIGLM